MTRRYPKSPYLVLALVVLVLDQISKWLVETKLTGAAVVEVIPSLLNFIHVRNSGVAFGLFASSDASRTVVLTLLGLAALAVVGVYFWRAGTSDGLLLTALGLILGGAVGNLADRILQGGVTDFIDFYFGTYHWHTFNVADSAITIGIGLMLIDMFRTRDAVDDVDDADHAEDADSADESAADEREERATAGIAS